ncbi:haloacid dehalogenase-like hydrolase [Paenibacillus xylaniclasticus]|uniref:haloacid dehalogenase-like hydrolase n=1 Tax=Paenibacillus xylaniclasticus TaxID=588083 RepID=UPI000FDC8E88|nr:MULTISPECIES: HAD family hydrolase [Paenibacillus]GFN32733.1 hypothetical protein PCURB6_29930 [Paenibacillus curdlanolyticus]
MPTLQKVADEWLDCGVRRAVFDVDNTLTRSNVVGFYLFVRSCRMNNKLRYRFWLIWFAISRVPFYILLDFLNRDWFQRIFYRCYRRIPLAELEAYAERYFDEVLRFRFLPGMQEFVTMLQQRGIEVELLSTSISPIVEQYSRYFGIPHHSLSVSEAPLPAAGTLVHLAGLKHFKRRRMLELAHMPTAAIADSKHDRDALAAAAHALIITSKRKRWMKQLNNASIHIINKTKE